MTTQTPNAVTNVMPAEAGAPLPPASNRMLTASSQVRPLQLNTFEEMWRFAGALAKSGMLPKSYLPKDGKLTEDEARAKAMVALQLGAEVGLQPMQSIQSIYVVNGVPTLWGAGQLAVVRQSGLMVKFKEWVTGAGLDMVAYCQVQRRGEDEATFEFSWKDAVAAGLTGKDTYKQHPKRMCGMRARSRALNDIFPDVLKGLTHTYEEMLDVTPEKETQPTVTRTADMGALLEAEAGASLDVEIVAEASEETAAAITEAVATAAENADEMPA